MRWTVVVIYSYYTLYSCDIYFYHMKLKTGNWSFEFFQVNFVTLKLFLFDADIAFDFALF